MQDMTSLLRFLIVLFITAVSSQALAQGTSGSIQGTVVDSKNEPLINAVIEAVQGGISKGGAVTDFDGNFVIKPLAAGRYDLKVRSLGYKETITAGVIVSPDKATEVKTKMQPTDNTLDEIVVIDYKIPLIDKFASGGTTVKTSQELEAMPTRNTTSMVATSAGAYSQTDGGAVSMTGARTDGTLYIIDGMQVYGSRGINLPAGAIDQMQVITSGVPAKYGDAIGGVVTITTKGVSDKIRGGIMLERSVDGYGHNLGNFNISGPLLKKRIDSVNKKPIVGFFLSGDAWYDQDRRPSYHGNYAVKEDVLERIQQNPLIGVPNQSGTPIYRNSAETVTGNDLYISKRRLNAQVFEGRLSGRLDFQLDENVNLSAGGTFNYSKANAYTNSWSLFSPNDIPVNHNYTGRGFIRLTQSFKKGNATPAEGEVMKAPLISNAFYTIQADYQIDYTKQEHVDHKRNLFNYGYLGKFNTQYQPIYSPGYDPGTGEYATLLLVDRFATQTTYERSELNPLLANYASQFFRDRNGVSQGNEQEIVARNSLINGFMPQSIYGLYTTTGQSNTGFNMADVQQYSVSVDASFDLQPGKTRHSIEFGLYYQQRTESGYSISAAGTTGGLWQYMRQLTNSHISLDTGSRIYIINGQRYTEAEKRALNLSVNPSDTIMYQRIASGTQSNFDRNLRQRLNLGQTDYIAIDQLDPSQLSVDMFSADELLNAGNPYVSYNGYDYKGNRQRGQVNFNDFFTKKDANGNYTRDIGSFRPNYIAGYILDKFEFKDISFNIGLRVERFDANTKVLKDPYSLYEVNTVANARSLNARNSFVEGGGAPSNIGDDYVVYVNSNESVSPSVVGYRSGDTWYDPSGRVVEDPRSLTQYSGGRDPQPFLANSTMRITDSTFDPNSSFTDYKPQINVMPRIQFNFPISEEAQFYAHYDVLVQRPRSGVFTPASSYYFMTANPGAFINNPDLKPEKSFDYEIGFKQKISEQSALTMSAFYKERKDMIQVRPYLYAWPTTYYTFGNRDFSTTKGMMLRYDMRRTGNIRLDIAYTLQFANGTGSSSTSSISGSPSAPGLLSGFISAGLPNIRTVFPLDVDVRHNIATTIDYRYAKGKGPMVGNMHILQDAGANLQILTRSGEPYTRYTLPGRVANTVNGQVNGARQPWHLMLNLKVDKNFQLNFASKKKEVTKPTRELYLNAFVLITNLLNTRDILSLDGYTGRTDDDGYLTHPQGMQTARNQFNAQSYVDLYSANVMGLANGNVNLPRRINLGLNFNF